MGLNSTNISEEWILDTQFDTANSKEMSKELFKK